MLQSVRKAAKKASVIYAFSEPDHDFFSQYTTTRKMVDGATSVGNTEIRVLAHGDTLEILWVGQLTDRKLPFLIIDLMKQYPDLEDKVSFTILGSGVRKVALTEALAVSRFSNIRLLDQIPHKEVATIMRDSHFLLHTSYREAGTHIIPEALSSGLPVICHEVSGMNLTISPLNGFKVQLVSYAHSIDKIAAYLYEIIRKPDIVAEKSCGAISFSKVNTWDHMAEVFRKDYLNGK
jgi:glycosyltransferase involved in cell wall biosynthesis